MADYYVDATNGDDSDTGGSGDPFETLQAAIDSATGGDTIHVANTSAVGITVPITWNTGFGSTSATAYLVIRAWDNGGSLTLERPNGDTETCGQIDDAAGQSMWDSVTSRPNYVVLDHIKFTGLSVTTSAYWEISACELDGKDTEDGITASTLARVHGCYLHDIVGVGIDCTSTENTLVGNRVRGVTMDGIRANDSCFVAFNVVEDFADNGIEITGGNHENVVIHNTVNGNGGSQTSSTTGIKLDALRNVCYGNIVANMAGTSCVGINVASGDASGLIGNNAFYNNTTDTNFVGTVALEPTNITESSDPFTDAANGDYSLVSGASSLDASRYVIGGHIGAVQTTPSASGSSPSAEIAQRLKLAIRSACGEVG